jgi:hypothetical protein
MRSAITAFVLLAASQMVFAQSSVTVSISEGSKRAGVVAERTAPYETAPSASITATPMKGRTPTAAAFRIRAWQEDGKARVVVFAVQKDSQSATGEREVKIATYLLALGESVKVAQTEQYGAAPITVNAHTR